MEVRTPHVQATTSLLVVDDEPAVGEFVRRVACDAGFAATAIADSPNFSAPGTTPPDLLVLDLQMPGRDGVEMIRDLANNHKNTAILLVSGLGARMLASAADLATAQGLRVVGVLTKPISYSELLGALRRAKEALNSATPEEPDMPAAIGPEEVSTAALGEAMKTGRIGVHYQPIFALAGTRSPTKDQLVGLEALARWDHPALGPISPSVFVRAAEQRGLGSRLNWYVLTRALAELRANGVAGVPVSVNFSAADFADVELPDRVVRAIDDAGLSAGAVNLELTESSVIHDLTSVLDTMMRLRMKGIGLWLDDFGTGYSSMEQLGRLPLTGVKIDRSFVPARPEIQVPPLLQSLVDISHKLGLPALCEGVETARQLQVIRETGCDLVQGFHLARPMTATNLATWMATA